MNIDINELKELTNSRSTIPAHVPKGQYIVILDRGFVYVGDITIECDWLNITKAKNIRYWGTKNGLGELRNGPLSETKLDEVGEVMAPLKSLIHLIPCKGF
jgi:hypothetical protein